ncbi:Protein FAM65C [Cricetulus griseus]|uniref:Protein FAM65C n=1 Tax=Cricetulus griseus TaxID=10029 RepID=G3HEU3_CRIGR|nr:Protein FAM65C [Cricetulus griseus]ERE71801.1 protein FAM65C-like protein [Cricetulus griseus]
MSVRLRFLSPGDVGAVGTVGRSASFAGFSAQSRRVSKSINRNSVRSRLPAKPSKAYGTLRKGSLCLDPRPQQVKKIFDALKRGLREHLCEQQAELDYLCGRHTDSQRSSRLAFYYDLDKVDELYEGYCIQWRLRDGASNMQRAFSNGTQSRASRESLQELGRSLQECMEDMCLIEGALEVHLGEFHVKMKGLVGYARLCPGDQYEVLMRLGRQRWRLKGRIEPDDSQTWDEEEKAFVPTVHENLEIKVTELRGLSSMVVGAVTCDIADFFTARPQLVVVDITELGTIKLQLELLWNPLDSECRLVSPSPTGRFSMGSRKGSLYTWTPPSTPSFRDKYYLSVLQQPAQQALLLGGPRATSILGYLSDSELQGPCLRSRSQELLEMDSFSSEDPRDTETSTSASTSDVGFLPMPVGPTASIDKGTREEPPPLGLLPGLAHPAGGVLVEQPGWRDLGGERLALLQDAPIHSPMVPRSQKGQEEEDVGDGVERPVQEVLDLLRSANPTQPQLRELEYQVLGLRDRLKPRGVPPEPMSVQSLMDCILESFAFLNADLASDELSLFGGSQAPERDSPPPPRPSLKVSPSELTAGAPELDMLLTVHLQICKALLQKLASPNLSRMVQDCLLEEAEQQRQVLEVLSDLDFEQVSKARSVEEMCRRLLEQVLNCGGLLATAGLQEEQMVTWFQFHSYLQRQSVSDLEKHLNLLCKEVTLIEELHCAGPAKALRKLHGKRLGQLQPLPQTLQAWALLQLDGSPRVCRAARARLASAARNRRFREKALLYYTNALNDSDATLQQAACMALQQLGGVESVEHIASLCRSDLEAVRVSAREATLSFGNMKPKGRCSTVGAQGSSEDRDKRAGTKQNSDRHLCVPGEKGRLAFEKMDKLQSEQEIYQEADVEITIF